MAEMKTYNRLPDLRSPARPRRQPPIFITVMIAAGLLLVAAAAAGLLLTNNAVADRGTAQTGPVRAGMRMENFALQDLNGKTVRLNDYRGKVVLINAWATWCPPCRLEMPDLNALYQENMQKGFTVLAVNAGETRDQAAGFASQAGLQFPVLLDPDEALMDRLNIRDFPTSILLGRDGLVKAVHAGMLSRAQMDEMVLPYLP